MFADFDLPGGTTATKVFVKRNGTGGPLKEVTLPPNSKLTDLFDKSAKVLDLDTDAPQLAFYSNGIELLDVENIEEDEVIHISCGEPFKATDSKEGKGSQVIGNFILHEKLGQGGFGSVIKGVHTETGEAAAVKFVPKKSFRQFSDLQRVFQEIQALRNLRHPNVIRILDVADHPDSVVFIMEFAAGGELRGYVERHSALSEEETRNFFKQIVRAVHYIHSKKIIHRDLKLENILLDANNRCKIVDFGLSDYVSSKERTVTDAGTEAYLAPEVYNGCSGSCDPYKIDVWGLGVILYALAHGKLPFSRPDEETCAKLDADGLNFKEVMTTGYRRLVKVQLTPNPERRASMDAITLDTWVTKHRFASCEVLGPHCDDDDALESLEDLMRPDRSSTPDWLHDTGAGILAGVGESGAASDPVMCTPVARGRRPSDLLRGATLGTLVVPESPRPRIASSGAAARRDFAERSKKSGSAHALGTEVGVRPTKIPSSPARADSRGAALRRAGAGVGANGR